MSEHAPQADALKIADLSLSVDVDGEKRPLLDGVSIQVATSETVALVGESGSGKSVTSRAALGLFPDGATVQGSVRVDGAEIVGQPAAEIQRLRRGTVSMVFQDPRSAINPVRRVGDFLIEGLRAQGVGVSEAKARVTTLLGEVGIREPAQAMRRFPHEFSGGMLQRIVIAGALSTQPRLLLADEATTALDVTTQAEVVGLLKRMQRTFSTGLLFVTHDLELAAAISDRIYVMYAGRVVESGPTRALFASPQHPYTVGLLNSAPRLADATHRLTPIAGRPRALVEAPTGCAFRDRCDIAVDACAEAVPPLRTSHESMVACIRAGEALVTA